jgi:DNA-binding MarR family transcriptional regulator
VDVDCRRAAFRRAGTECLTDQVWRLLLQLSFNSVHHHFGAAVAELNLAPTQAMALHELEVEQSISMRELAERLRSDPSSITGLVDRLEARGLVERRAHPRDRRVKGLALTPAGAQLRERLLARLYAAPSGVAQLSETDQRSLRALLVQLLEAE